MHIRWIDVSVPPLANDPSKNDLFICDRHINLFIGPNASGKTTTLRAIKGLTSWGEDGWFEDEAGPFPLYGKGTNYGFISAGVNYEFHLDTSYYPKGADCPGSGASIWEAVPFL